MSHSSVGRRAMSKLCGMHLPVQLGELLETHQISPSTSVVETKHKLSVTFKVPRSSQKVFHSSTELTNRRTLNDYHIFDVEQPGRELTVELNPPGYMRSLLASPFIGKVLSRIEAAFKRGVAPRMTAEGTGGTYILCDVLHQPLAVFKPSDEEPFAPHNPRGSPGELGSPSLRPGVLSGESAVREVAAYLLDRHSFSDVPETALVESLHSAYAGPAQSKLGSLQVFVHSLGCAEDFAPTMFSKEQVHKIAVLDIRALNMDRNVANLLVNKDMELTPIDHGLAFPRCLEIEEEDLCWMYWPQAKEAFSPSTLDYIASINVSDDIALLEHLTPLSYQCLRNVRVSGMLLQKGAAHGLNLFEIGSMLYRRGKERSELELLVEKAKQLYHSSQKPLPMGIHRQRSSAHLEDRVDSKIDACKICNDRAGHLVFNITRTGTDQCFAESYSNEKKLDEKFFQIIGMFMDHAISDKLRKGPTDGNPELHCRSK